MTRYVHPRIHRYRIYAAVLRDTAAMLKFWPLILLGLLIVQPLEYHLRINYSYETRSGQKFTTQCTYLGIQGIVKRDNYGICPVIARLKNNS